jgi:hypothetical protein
MEAEQAGLARPGNGQRYTSSYNAGGNGAPPKDRMTLSASFERNQGTLGDLHEEINAMEATLGPVLAAAPQPTDAGSKIRGESPSFVDRFDAQHELLRSAIRRLRDLRERLVL